MSATMTETVAMPGAWTTIKPPESCNPPKEVTHAFEDATHHLLGAKYEMVAYLEKQVVAGMKYLFAATQTIVMPGAHEDLVLLEIFAPPSGTATIVHIEHVKPV